MFPWDRYGDDYTDGYGKSPKPTPNKARGKAEPAKNKPSKDKTRKGK